MAEPVGITGTAAGLVSLGLQVYGEISKYIDAVKGRKRELDEAKRSADTLQKCLTAIDEIIGPVTAQSTASEAVETCRLSCEDEINALGALVERLRGPLTPADTLSAKVREKGRQLTYPFHRGDVLELEKRLESTNDRLQTALHTLELNISRDIQGLVTTLNSDVQAVKLRFDRSGAALARVANTVESSSGRLEQLIPEIHTQTTRTSLMVAQQAQTLSQTTQVSIRLEETAQQTQTRFDRTDDVLLQLVKGQQEMNQQMLQLIARPSHLRSLCDEFPVESPADPTRPNDTGAFESRMADFNYRPCPCVRRRKLQRNKRTFGPLFLETEFSETTHHAPHCRLSRLKPSEQQRKRGFGITIPALQSILDKAIRVSLFLNTGAGGLSLSQSISWVATVNSQQSPAFRLARLASRAIWTFQDSQSQELSFRVINSCVNRLSWCYEQRLASPADVDEEGRTVFAVAVAGIPGLNCQPAVFMRFARRLLESRVPVNTNMGKFGAYSSVLSYIIKYRWTTKTEPAYELARALAFSGAESERLNIGVPDHSSTIINAFQMLKTFPNYAEMLNVGPLMMAILRQDLSAVRDLVDKYPSYVLEKDNDGITAIHAAVLVSNPRILGLVLRYSNAELVNTADLSHHYPIDYALNGYFHKVCQISPDPSCIRCTGCEILEALLQSGSALSASSIESELRMDVEVNHSSTVRQIVLRYLRDRRVQLQALARKRLPGRDRQRLGIPTLRVLDRHALHVQRLLEAMSVKIPPELMVFDGNNRFQDFENLKTVYAHIWDRKTAQYAWELGFQDIGPDTSDGFYQIIKYMGVSDEMKVGRSVVAYASWLVGHGLKLKAVVEVPDTRDSKPTYAHYLMAFLGHIDFDSDDKLTMSSEVSGAVFSEPVKDGCLCGCASGGCSPLIKFLRPAKRSNAGGRNEDYARIERPWEICQTILGMIPRKERSGGQYSWIYRGILRYFTFAALGLRHTCCNHRLHHFRFDPVSDRLWKMDDENIEEIRKEEEDGLLLLETLVAEFEAECGCNSRLVQFLQEYWEPRMKQVRKDIDRRRLTNLESQTAEELGVVWGPDDYEEWDRGSIPSSSCDEEMDLEDVMEMMDDIAPDPRRRA